MKIQTLRRRIYRLATHLAGRSLLMTAAAIVILTGAYALAGFYLVPRLITRLVSQHVMA